jgi:hypothetical protein
MSYTNINDINLTGADAKNIVWTHMILGNSASFYETLEKARPKDDEEV